MLRGVGRMVMRRGREGIGEEQLGQFALAKGNQGRLLRISIRPIVMQDFLPLYPHYCHFASADTGPDTSSFR